MEKIYFYEKKYITKNGEVKTALCQCKKTLKNTPKTGRPKLTISDDKKEEILEYLKTNNIKDTCEEFGISRYLLKTFIR